MALSAQEQADIIFFLGYPAKVLLTDSTDYSKIVADRLIGLTSPYESRIRNLLDRLTKLDCTIQEAYSRLSAKAVGDIQLRDDEIWQLKKERKRVVGQLSDLVGLAVQQTGSGGISISV